MRVMSFAMMMPLRTPPIPPMKDRVADSMRNCVMTSLRRAPSALRTPISRVRSVTETSMMFMMTMPPTTSEMAASETKTAKKLELMLCQMPTKV